MGRLLQDGQDLEGEVEGVDGELLWRSRQADPGRLYDAEGSTDDDCRC